MKGQETRERNMYLEFGVVLVGLYLVTSFRIGVGILRAVCAFWDREVYCLSVKTDGMLLPPRGCTSSV